MLILGDIRELEFMPSDEACAKFHQEEIEPLHDTYRLDDHQHFKNLHSRSGQWLHSSELAYQVQRLNPAIFIEQQINFADQWGFYIESQGQQKYVSGFRKGWMREFSAYLVDERDLMTGDEIRGWRTVLLRLMGLGLLSWAQVHSTFGDSEGVNAKRWLHYTQPYRQGNCESVILRNIGG